MDAKRRDLILNRFAGGVAAHDPRPHMTATGWSPIDAAQVVDLLAHAPRSMQAQVQQLLADMEHAAWQLPAASGNAASVNRKAAATGPVQIALRVGARNTQLHCRTQPWLQVTSISG